VHASPSYKTIYSLTEYDMPLLLAAGFKGQDLFWDLLWASDREGVLWQVSVDSDELVQFFEHDNDLRRKAPRPMTRQEFLRRFGV